MPNELRERTVITQGNLLNEVRLTRPKRAMPPTWSTLLTACLQAMLRGHSPRTNFPRHSAPARASSAEAQALPAIGDNASSLRHPPGSTRRHPKSKPIWSVSFAALRASLRAASTAELCVCVCVCVSSRRLALWQVVYKSRASNANGWLVCVCVCVAAQLGEYRRHLLRLAELLDPRVPLRRRLACCAPHAGAVQRQPHTRAGERGAVEPCVCDEPDVQALCVCVLGPAASSSQQAVVCRRPTRRLARAAPRAPRAAAAAASSSRREMPPPPPRRRPPHVRACVCASAAGVGGGADAAEAESLCRTLADQREMQEEALSDLSKMAAGLRDRTLKCAVGGARALLDARDDERRRRVEPDAPQCRQHEAATAAAQHELVHVLHPAHAHDGDDTVHVHVHAHEDCAEEEVTARSNSLSPKMSVTFARGQGVFEAVSSTARSCCRRCTAVHSLPCVSRRE